MSSFIASSSRNSDRSDFCPKINKLQAIAVVAVIIFHLNESWLPLGYLGVDIFFVLSGFLISKIILRDIDSGKFKLSNFISRRIKRNFQNCMSGTPKAPSVMECSKVFPVTPIILISTPKDRSISFLISTTPSNKGKGGPLNY